MRVNVDSGGVHVVLLCIGASIVYGIIHDMVTAHLCVEYFTIGHANVFGVEDPTLLALWWGVLGTWWMGLFLGIPMAFAARHGDRPKRSARSLVLPIGVLLVVTALCATAAGVAGWSSSNFVDLGVLLSDEVPEQQSTAFFYVWSAHLASHFVGVFGGVVLCLWVSFRRGRGKRIGSR